MKGRGQFTSIIVHAMGWICRVLDILSNAIVVLRQFHGFEEGTFTNIKQTNNLINFLSVCFESGYNKVIFFY